MSDGGKHQRWWENLGHAIGKFQSRKPGLCEHECIKLPFIQLAQSCFHVSTDILNTQIRPDVQQLRLPPAAAGSYPRVLGKLIERAYCSTDQHVGRASSFRNRCKRQVGDGLRREVFETVHRKIDAVGEKRGFDLLDEDSFRANSSEFRLFVQVAGRLDEFQARVNTAIGEQGGDAIGLPSGEAARARADANRFSLFGHDVRKLGISPEAS